MAIKPYNVTLDDKVVEEAKKLLDIGQSFSPVLNRLLELWIIDKLLLKKRMGKTPQRKEKI